MSQLVEIAKMLKSKARQHPDAPITYNLRNGLGLHMTRMGIYWKLRLTRDNVAPSEGEVSIIRRDFDVPDEAYRTNSIPVNTTDARQYAVDLSWPESTLGTPPRTDEVHP